MIKLDTSDLTPSEMNTTFLRKTFVMSKATVMQTGYSVYLLNLQNDMSYFSVLGYY